MSPRPFPIDPVLVPVGQSEEATRAAGYAATVAAEYDAAVHAVHVLGENAVRAMEQGVVDEDAVAEDNKAVTDTMSALAETVNAPVATSVVYGFSRMNKLHHLGNVVLDAAEELDTDFIVVPQEPVSGDPGEVLAKTAEYVLPYVSQPVSSV